MLSVRLIVWGCGCVTTSSVGGWVSDLGCVGVCGVCLWMPPGGLIVGVGAVLGVLLRGAADLWMISPAGCVGRVYQRAGRLLCGFGILPNKFLQRKGPCIYRAIACKSSVCINGCTACKL